jgi:nucleoside-diphosphate-sugar epimerase
MAAGVHLVTGGAGFLGSHTARALAARGERVRVLDVIETPDRPAGIEFVRADVRDARAVRAAMDGVGVVHHHAAMVPLTKAGAQFREVNVDGTQNALDAARAVGARLFIHVSTSAVYGLPERCPITDETPLRPLEAYGRAKLEGEARVERAAREGLPCAIVRPRTLIGTERLGIFQILFEWIHEGRRIYVLGDGRQRFQLLHVDDAIDFLLRLAEQGKTGVFNIGAERFGTLREDLGALVRHAGTRSRVTGIPAAPAIALLGLLDRLHLSPLAPWHYLTYHKPFFFDLTRPMRELGWRPRFGNVEALTQSYDWFIAHRDDPDGAHGRSTHRKSVRQGVLRLLKGLS